MATHGNLWCSSFKKSLFLLKNEECLCFKFSFCKRLFDSTIVALLVIETQLVGEQKWININLSCQPNTVSCHFFSQRSDSFYLSLKISYSLIFSFHTLSLSLSLSHAHLFHATSCISLLIILKFKFSFLLFMICIMSFLLWTWSFINIFIILFAPFSFILTSFFFFIAYSLQS